MGGQNKAAHTALMLGAEQEVGRCYVDPILHVGYGIDKKQEEMLLAFRSRKYILDWFMCMQVLACTEYRYWYVANAGLG